MQQIQISPIPTASQLRVFEPPAPLIAAPAPFDLSSLASYQLKPSLPLNSSPRLNNLYQIRPDLVVVYPNYDSNYTPRHTRLDNLSKPNRTKPYEKGHLSPNSIRRIRYAIKLLNASALPVTKVNSQTGEIWSFKLNFITLTLPSAQGSISDGTIKRKALNPLITALRKRFGYFNYVWKAESQDNGNIHFHLTTDKWMNHSHIRQYWNAALARLGYVAQYRENRLRQFQNGFLMSQNPNDKRTEAQQKKAYDFGLFTDWSQPNTVDVHSVRKINNVESYLIKYLSKIDKSRRPIEGKLWGCSEFLTYDNKFTVNDCDIPLENLNFMQSLKHIEVSAPAGINVILYSPHLRRNCLGDVISAEYVEWLAYVRTGGQFYCQLKLPYIRLFRLEARGVG